MLWKKEKTIVLFLVLDKDSKCQTQRAKRGSRVGGGGE